ncbi:hypothetical protein ACFSKU_00165 [Pontibacter silvestris]|uniref:Uncharacterized protein n=1 Tax=Pontibacter silvestris TaxID=2305183 RepID=A0ABW4WSZ1_9BACT|nr:hypothetical protein [Pontibacter silvestris]MCC9138574.1 hypothetical protein [Pontibacter silvestris]
MKTNDQKTVKALDEETFKKEITQEHDISPDIFRVIKSSLEVIHPDEVIRASDHAVKTLFKEQVYDPALSNDEHFYFNYHLNAASMEGLKRYGLWDKDGFLTTEGIQVIKNISAKYA